jgi:glycosyltransferase involved in cell wall biosynthesis
MVKPILRQLAMQHPILWLTYPAHVPLVGAFNEKLVCYDCMDNYPAFYHPNTARARLATSQEQRLLAGADCVTTTALSLHRRLSAQHPHVYIVRNAVGEEFLAHSGSRSTPPPDWPPGDGPVIGYMGAIAPWLDFEAVTQLAIRHPNWRIVFIGPSEIDLSSYNRLTNVHFLGPKPYDELIGYVAQFDIGLIPFVKNELTVNVNPVKIYEYFALGKPVVATSLPELWPFSQLCYLADNAAEFAQQVERAVEDLKAANPEAAARRRALAQANTWIARTAKIINILESRLAVKQTI